METVPSQFFEHCESEHVVPKFCHRFFLLLGFSLFRVYRFDCFGTGKTVTDPPPFK